MSYTKEDTIFVQIGCYRDSELQWTLKDLFEKAKIPENIFVGIFLQYDKQDGEDDDLFQIEFPRRNQLRIEEIDYRDSVSICYSKNKTAKLYKNEKYVLQTDSHMRFRENWDEILVNDFKSIEHKNPVLCSIMPSYTLEPVQTDFNSSGTRMGIFETNNTFRNYLSNIQLKNKFEYSSAFFGPFLFFEGKLLQCIKCNEQYGSNDEFPTCVKVFTNGANMFYYKTTVVNHLYGNNITNKMKKARVGYFNSIDSNEIFRHQFNIKKTNNKEILDNINKYPLGTKRTLRDYERFTGVDFRKLTVKYHGYIGVFEE